MRDASPEQTPSGSRLRQRFNSVPSELANKVAITGPVSILNWRAQHATRRPTGWERI